jgi:FtsH-binding integral membrane protein
MGGNDERTNDGPRDPASEIRYDLPAAPSPSTWLRILGFFTLGLAVLLTLSGTILIARSARFADAFGTPLRQVGLLVMLVALIVLTIDYRLRIAAQRIRAIFERERRHAAAPAPSLPQNVPTIERSTAGDGPISRSNIADSNAPIAAAGAGETKPLDTAAPSVLAASLPPPEWLQRPGPRSGFPLMGLFVLTAICAVLIGLMRPALQTAADDEQALNKVLAAALIGMFSLGTLGLFFGALDERRASGMLLGTVTGSILGLIVGPIAIVPSQHLPSLIGASIGGSAVILILAGLARIGSRAAGK